MKDAPALLSLGKLCSENGFEYQWKHGQKPYLSKGNIRIPCDLVQNVPLICAAPIALEVTLSRNLRKRLPAEDLPAGGDSKPSAEEPDPKRHWKKVEHNLFTHFPKDPNCEVCRTAKSQRAQCRKKVHGEPGDLPTPEKFADSVTADHAILSENEASRKGDRVALIMQDRFSSWLQGYPALTKDAEDTKRAFQRFLGPKTVPEHVYTDGSPEFKRSLLDLGFSHDTCSSPQTSNKWCGRTRCETSERRNFELTSSIRF